MRKIYWFLFLFMLPGLLLGCKSTPTQPTLAPTETPTLETQETTPTPIEPPGIAQPGEQYLVGLQSIFTSTQVTITDGALFPIEKFVYIMDSDELLVGRKAEDSIRMALALRVSVYTPPEEMFDINAPTSWVLLHPEGEAPPGSVWQQIGMIPLPDGNISTTVGTMPISEMLSFVDTGTITESLASLNATLMAAETVQEHLWLWAVLIETSDTQTGTKSWMLYLLSAPVAPGDGDAKVTVCCNWAKCGKTKKKVVKAGCQMVGCSSRCK